MTSKSKDLTESTQPSFSADGTVVPAQPSLPSASSESTPISMQTTKTPLPGTSNADNTASNSRTTVPTTLPITEKSRQHAVIAKAALKMLERAGLIKRFKVLSEGSTTVTKIRFEFEMSIWSEELDLR